MSDAESLLACSQASRGNYWPVRARQTSVLPCRSDHQRMCPLCQLVTLQLQLQLQCHWNGKMRVVEMVQVASGHALNLF